MSQVRPVGNGEGSGRMPGQGQGLLAGLRRRRTANLSVCAEPVTQVLGQQVLHGPAFQRQVEHVQIPRNWLGGLGDTVVEHLAACIAARRS